jgi:F-type H+-transporting ATPase subunit b
MIPLATALTAAGGEGESPSVLAVPLDEFILGIVAFFIVFFVLWKFVLPNIEKTLNERSEAIEGGIERAAAAEAEAKAMMAKYKEQIAGAHEEAANIRADGKAIVDEARKQADAERSAIAQRGEAQLAAERTQTVAALRQDVGGLAVTLAGRIVGESLEDDQRANAVVDRFIADLEQSAAKDQA